MSSKMLPTLFVFSTSNEVSNCEIWDLFSGGVDSYIICMYFYISWSKTLSFYTFTLSWGFIFFYVHPHLCVLLQFYYILFSKLMALEVGSRHLVDTGDLEKAYNQE